MKSYFTAPPGTSLPSLALTGGNPINSVQVDNPSGGWLWLQEPNVYVPPYTLNFSADLEYSAASISVVWGKSPAGQVSTAQGDAYNVIINSESNGNDSGESEKFIQQFTPLSTFNLEVVQFAAGAAQIVSSSSALTGGTRRLRIHGAYLTAVDLLGADNIAFIPRRMAAWFQYGSLAQTISPILTIGASKVRDSIQFNPTLDLGVGVEIFAQLECVSAAAAALDPSFYNVNGWNGTADIRLTIQFELI